MAFYNKGDEVRSKKRGIVGMVKSLDVIHGGIQYYEVFWGGSEGSEKISVLDLEPFQPEEKPTESLIKGTLGGYQDFLRLITQQRLSRSVPLRNNIYAFNASRTRFFPYQFKPLIKFLDSPDHRLLICDEVGLGKTIEAGLILTELRARQTVRRVIVVCPANLSPKWRLELKKRFGEEFDILSAQKFLDYLEEYESDPDRSVLNGILSIESARQDRVLERLEYLSPQFDLMIVDEAHHLRNFATKQRRAGVLLGSSANAVLMLTATPIHLGNDNLFSLLNILDDEDFPDLWTSDTRFKENEPVVRAQSCMGQIPPKVAEAISFLESCRSSAWFAKNPLYLDVQKALGELLSVPFNSDEYRGRVIRLQRELAELNLLGHILTRTRKREVHSETRTRHVFALEVSLSAREKEFYDSVTAFIRAESEAKGHSTLIQQWRLNTPQRRMASCIPAMVEYYRTQIGFDVEDSSEDLDDEPSSTENNSETKGEFDSARSRLRQIISNWPADGPDSKYAVFLSALRGVRSERGGKCKVMVFAFFKDTLRYLSTRLESDGFASVIISGDVLASERPEIIERFQNDPAIEVLLSSRVGGEGLDFQFCNTMFNYDLPWNPMEVEQRIGRLDRIGQESSVIHIYNLWVEGTIEERILKRLYDRIGVFERSIGALETILGEITRQLEAEVFSKSLTRQEENEKVEMVIMTFEARLRDLERLESEAARFVGTDQYFNEEVEAIRSRRRYVTGEQLRRYVMDFLRYHAPRARLEYEPVTKQGVLYPDEILKEFLQSRGKGGEAFFLFQAGERGVDITFDSQVAFQKPRIEFLSVLHPLVAAINEQYQDKGDGCRKAQHVVLRTDLLQKGYYYYFVFRLRVQGARPRNTLECVLLDENLEEPCDLESSETVFGEMVEKGEEAEGASLEVTKEIAGQAKDRAVRLFLDRLEGIRKEYERSNDLFLENRLASLNTSYGKNIKRQEELLEKARREGRQERYIRMIEGTLRRLRGERELKTKEINLQRDVEVSYEEVAAGILEVA